MAVTIKDASGVTQNMATTPSTTGGTAEQLDLVGLATVNSGVTTVISAANPLPASAADGAQVTTGSMADAAWSGGSGSIVAILKAVANSLANLFVTASLQPKTSGGLTVYRNISLLATGINVKNSAGQIYGYYLGNTSASPRYIKLYDKVTAPTVGTDTPLITIFLPAGAAANESFGNGIAFVNGIGIAATQLVADSDTTAPAANDVISNLFYH